MQIFTIKTLTLFCFESIIKIILDRNYPVQVQVLIFLVRSIASAPCILLHYTHKIEHIRVYHIQTAACKTL